MAKNDGRIPEYIEILKGEYEGIRGYLKTNLSNYVRNKHIAIIHVNGEPIEIEVYDGDFKTLN